MTGRWAKRILVTAVALLAGLALGYAKFMLVNPFRAIVESGGMAGPDSYTRLLRVEQLLQTGKWYQTILPELNAPAGIELHWTRLLDALIAPIALATQTLGVDDRASLLIAGKLIGPLLLGITLLIICRVVRPFTSLAALLLVPTMLFLAHQTIFQFMWARADHHSLLLLLFAASFACAALAVDRPSAEKMIHLAGVASALGLWVSVEALVALVCLIGILNLFWIIDGDVRFIRLFRQFSTAAFLTSAAALAVERPPDGWLEISYHRISIIHVIFLGLVTSGACALSFLTPRLKSTLLVRLICTVMIGTGLGLIYIWFFPLAVFPPFELFDPVVKELIIYKNVEYQPLFHMRQLMNGSTVANLGPALFVFILMLFSFRYTSNRTQRLILFLIFPISVYALLALFNGGRWGPYASILAIPPTIYFIDRFLRRYLSPVAWQIIAILVVLGPTLMAVLIVVLTHEEGKGQYHGCDWHKSGELFDKVSRARDRSSIVLTDVFAGPEVAWFTGLRVVAGPYGESSSIEDAQRAFLSTNFEPMREVVSRRGVNYVLICEPEDVSSEAASNSVNERLLTGSDLPAWLLPLEDDNSLNLRLYRVVEDKI